MPSRHAPPSNAPTHHGAGPYRDAPLSLPQRPSAPRRGVGLLGAAVVTFGLVRALHRPTKPPVSAPAPYIEHASSLAGGARITAVFSDRDARHPDVLRIPGTAARHGVDAVVPPEVLAGNGAVAAVPDGEHLLDEHGALLRVRDGVVAPLPGAEVAPFAVGELLPARARVVQRAGDFARMDNGGLFALRNAPSAGPALATRSLVRDVATDREVVCALDRADRVACAHARHWEAPTGPNTPDTWAHPVWIDVEPLAGHEAEQVVVGGGVACVRDRGGGVYCARLNLLRRGEDMAWMYALNVPLTLTGDAPRATAVAISRDDLCLLGVDGHLWCMHGPQEDAHAAIVRTPDGEMDAMTLNLHDAMEGVTEVGLAEGVGCARRRGRIDCWGPLARNGWVTRRERPVRIDVAGVPSLAAYRGLVYAFSVARGMCWGIGATGDLHPRPYAVGPAGAVTGLATERNGLCWEIEGRGHECWNLPEVPPHASAVQRTNRATAAGYACERTAAGGVNCGFGGSLTTVAGLTDVETVAVTDDGLACANNRSGEVWCWGDNTSGALTVAEAARSPRVVTLRR